MIELANGVSDTIINGPVVGVLLFIALTLVVGFLWLLKDNSKNQGRFGTGMMSVIETMAVAQTKTSAVLEALHADEIARAQREAALVRAVEGVAETLGDNTSALGAVMETVSVLTQDLTGAVNTTGAQFADVQNDVDELRSEITPMRNELQSVMLAIRENPCGEEIRQLLIECKTALTESIEHLEAWLTNLEARLTNLVLDIRSISEGENGHEGKTRPVYVSAADPLHPASHGAGADGDGI